jgi:hypothetical protein
MIKEMPGPVGLQRPAYACKEASVVSNTLIVSTPAVKSRDDQEIDRPTQGRRPVGLGGPD